MMIPLQPLWLLLLQQLVCLSCWYENKKLKQVPSRNLVVQWGPVLVWQWTEKCLRISFKCILQYTEKNPLLTVRPLFPDWLENSFLRLREEERIIKFISALNSYWKFQFSIFSKAYSEPNWISVMELFLKIVKDVLNLLEQSFLVR